MRALKTSFCIALLGAVLALAPDAHADGIAAKTSQLPARESASLLKQIEAFKASHPEAFEAVRNVKSHRPEVYKTFRNPIPTAVSRELRGLGPSALLPMLEALAFTAPARGSLTDAEWNALAAGMLEAVGVLRDARSGPVLAAIFEGNAASPEVLGAAARAMGRLGGDAELASLVKHTAANDPLRMHAIQGLGQMKRIESAKHLASLLSTAKDDATAEAISTALGLVGSSWAWQAMGPSAAATGLAVREVAARALVPSFVRTRGVARVAARDAIFMVEHPITAELLNASRRGLDADTLKDVDAVMKRLQK